MALRVDGYQYEEQADETDTTAPPTQNLWVTVLATTYNVRLIRLVFVQTNDDTTARDIEIEFVGDGNTKVGSLACANNTNYYPYDNGWGTYTLSGSEFNAGLYTDKRFKSLRIRYRTTSAPGTNMSMTLRIVFDQLKRRYPSQV